MHKFKFIGQEKEVEITIKNKKATGKTANASSVHTFYVIPKGVLLGQGGEPDRPIVEITDQPPSYYNVRL